jgi:glyoxylase-like metal-dependent hydrolase (beta-lactamase superfamily II)
MKAVAPGIYAITLPLPWELETVNVYLVRLVDGWMLVDSGIGTEACFDALRAGLDKGGIEWRDIHSLLLTHMHPDHVGLAAKILDLSGARLLMHRGEAAYLAEIVRENRAPHFNEGMQRAGVPVELTERITAIFGDLRRNFRALTPAWPLEGEESIPVEGGALRVIWTPGHSPGHVCLYSPEHRYLVSGDHVLQYITPNIQWHPGEDMLGTFLSSLEKLLAFDVEVILPSHGEPFNGVHSRVQETLEHHAERCLQIEQHLAGEPSTAHALVELIWQGRLSPFHHHFAVFEILAHLEYLERRSRVCAVSENGGPFYWKPRA